MQKTKKYRLVVTLERVDERGAGEPLGIPLAIACFNSFYDAIVNLADLIRKEEPCNSDR